MTLTLFLRCIFQIPPLRQPKDSGQRKMLGMSARRVITMSVLSDMHIWLNNEPPAPVNLWVGGVIVGCVELGLKTADQA